jgi:hypothetical protein
MTKKLMAMLVLGALLIAPPATAQGTTSASSDESSGGWTDLGTVTMKGRLGVKTIKFDDVNVREVRFAYDDTSSYRIGTVTVVYGPKPAAERWPRNFVSMDPVKRNSRNIVLKKTVPANSIRFLYSNLFEVKGMDVRVFVR